MAAVQLVLAVVGALFVVGSMIAWRHGEVRGAGLSVRRGDRLFAPVVALLAMSGVGLAAAAAWMATAAPPPRRLERGHRWELPVPASFQPLPDVEAELPPGGRALGNGESELVVVETEAAAARGVVGEILRRQAASLPLGDERVAVRELGSLLEVGWAYASPRGPVLARALGYVDHLGRMGWVTATCSHGGDARDCQAALGALVVTAPDRLPLSAAAPSPKAPPFRETPPFREPPPFRETKPSPSAP
jgi:hypothetical protein